RMEYPVMKTVWGFRTWLTGLVLVVISVAGASWLLNSGVGQSPQQPEIKRPGLNPRSTDSVTCVGYADLETRVLGLSPVQAGRVEQILVKEDDKVKAGQVLLRLDDRVAKFHVKQAEADVKAAEAELDKAKKLPDQQAVDLRQQKEAIAVAQNRLDAAGAAASRSSSLVKKELAPPTDLQGALALERAARAALEAEKIKLEKLQLFNPQDEIIRAESDLEAKKSRLDQAKYALTECSLVAPTDGTILRILIGKGEL